MPELTNSQRRILTTTYSPIKLEDTPEEVERLRLVRRSWEKLGFVRSLAIRQPEIATLRKRINELHADEEQRVELLKTLELVARVVGDPTPASMQHYAPELGKTDHRLLSGIGRLLVQSRRELVRGVEDTVENVRSRYALARHTLARPPSVASAAPAPTEVRRGNQPANTGVTGSVAAESFAAALDPRLAPLEGDRDIPSLEDALDWAATNDPQHFNQLHELAQSFSPAPPVYLRLHPSALIAALLPLVADWSRWTNEVVDGFDEQMKVNPVGRLHLERLQMTPVGIERGELVYSLPLAPRETVNISHKEWSLRSEEFEKIVQDQLEEYSEKGVTEKKDLSQSTTSESTHSQAYSLSASGSYYGISATVGFDSSSGDAQTQTDSRNRAIELTRKASSRTRQEHKQSFKVSAVAGTEDQAVRVITNPSETQPLRVDYYQMMRKWRVDLYRYGLRQTYDIVIPNPGAELIQKIDEIRLLDALIEKPFEFKLLVTHINVKNWPSYAAQYNASVEAPPESEITIQVHKLYTEPDDSRVFFDSLEFEVDPDYQIAEARIHARFDPDNEEQDDVYFDVMHADTRGPVKFRPEDLDDEAKLTYTSRLPHLVGKSGSLVVVYVGQELREGAVFLDVTAHPKPSAIGRWRFRAWSAIREAAEEKFFEDRQLLVERRAKLMEELGKFDALTLRQMEHEAVMKGVLRWLFGPEFDFIPDDIRNLFEPSNPDDPESIAVLHPNRLTNQQWARVMAWGEFIKFIHHAIEWENVLYFSYPYFWDPKNWDLKRFLDHPDAMHRTFLRAGSARVVLTVRPGFEVDFATVLETGSFSHLAELPADHPYITIAQEIQNFAKTNYPGIPPANPEDPENDQEVFDKEQGVLIGRWYEYTPTSALDIALNTPEADIA